jgi:NAD-dependent dihydropyrimidine dehydrogenase PreA subunit
MKYLKDVATLALDETRCIACGRCREVCPHAVFASGSGPARIIDRDACIECGACAANCPPGALSVKAGVGCAIAMLDGIARFGDPDAGSCCGGTDDPGGCC